MNDKQIKALLREQAKHSPRAKLYAKLTRLFAKRRRQHNEALEREIAGVFRELRGVEKVEAKEIEKEHEARAKLVRAALKVIGRSRRRRR